MINDSYKNWYKNISHKLIGSGVWLKGQELNTLPEEEFENRNFRVVFARLSTYQDTSYSFTHRILYQIAKNTEGVFPDLAYLPPSGDLKHFEAGNVPWILPTKTKFHVSNFDLIGFSNSIVQELINLPTLLRESGIPLSKKERLQNNEIPLIILGGANAMNTSLLFSDDPIIDGIFIGEDAACIRQILEICRDGKIKNLSKTDVLNQLENVAGFFQPDKISGLNQTESKKIIRFTRHDHIEQLIDAPVLYSDEAGSGTLQISEGCPYFCSFCSESWNRKPYTEENPETLLQKAKEMKANMGLDNIEFYSFNFNIHSRFYNLLWDLSSYFTNIGLKSQRFDHIAKDPEILKYLQVVGKSSITCGMEGISSRMRKYLHKNLDDHALYKSVDHLLRSTIRELKIFLIATGLETQEDYNEFTIFLNHITSILSKEKHKARIVFSITPLVRFPLTPLEFEDAYNMPHYSKIIDTVTARIKTQGFEVRNAADMNDYYLSQILVRAKEPQIFPALLKALENTGFIYYRDVPQKFINEFNKQLVIAGINPDDLLKGSKPENRNTVPWNIFDPGISIKYLEKTYNKCKNFSEINACFGTMNCNACGACPDKVHIDKITKAKQTRNYSATQLHQKMVDYKNSFEPINFIIEAGENVKNIPRKMLGVALARAMMLADNNLTEYYTGFKNSYWDKENKGTEITGEDIITLQWHKKGFAYIKDKLLNEEFIQKVNSILESEWGILINIPTEIPLKSKITIKCNSPLNLQEYLKNLHLKYTLLKVSDGIYNYDFTKDSLKKGIILYLKSSNSQAKENTIEMEVNGKFDLNYFIKECISKNNATNQVEISAKFIDLGY